MLRTVIVALALCVSDGLRLAPLFSRTLTRVGAHAADFIAPLEMTPLELVADHQAKILVQIEDSHQPTPLDLVAARHSLVAEELEELETTPLQLVERFHEGLEREMRVSEDSQGWSISGLLRSAWSRRAAVRDVAAAA